MSAARSLHGVRVLEFQGAGPVPFCGMLLADLGADVVLVARGRIGTEPYTVEPGQDVLHRGKRVATLDLKSASGRDSAQGLALRADILLEGFRPGVMERLGLGPEHLHALHPTLVYARVCGHPRGGADALRPGHDLNFLAESGVLHAMGSAGQVPLPPLNLIADFGGAGMLAAVGALAALLAARDSGRGGVIDISMLQASRLLMASICSWRASSLWNEARGTNFLDGSCPWYAVYGCADARMLAVASLEPAFYAALLRVLDLREFADCQWDRGAWDELGARMRQTFARKDSAHWLRLFAAEDACVSPVEPLPPLHADPREGWVRAAGILQPANTFDPCVGVTGDGGTMLCTRVDAVDLRREWAQPPQ